MTVSTRSPVLRWDAIHARWNLLAPARRDTPRDQTNRVEALRDASACPFCPGHERDAEPAVDEIRDERGAWLARAFPNRFPMMAGPSAATPSAAFFRERPAAGAHEVVVEAPAHDADLSDLPDDVLAQVLALYQRRHAALAATPGTRSVLLFKNRGARAGASLRHPHGQILSMDVVPAGVRRRDFVARQHHARGGTSVVGDALAAELADGSRIVRATEAVVSLCPFAPARSFETWIVPRTRVPHLGALDAGALASIATVLGDALRRVRRATGDADYNLLLRQPARRHWSAPWAWMYFEVQVRRGGDAGFELGSGMTCSVFSPEECAAMLRLP